MVKGLYLRRFHQDERGIALTEALLSLPIVILVLTAMVELGVATYQWNQSVKAVQIGARLAAVSSPLVGDVAYEALDVFEAAVNEGDAVPQEPLSVTCGPDSTPCDATRLDRLRTGGDGSCGSDGSGLTPQLVGMCDVAPFIGPENIQISYHRSFLGYAGRPFGPVSTITVELRDVTVDFLLLDSLIPALGSITIPAHPVSITSEDLNDCREECT